MSYSEVLSHPNTRRVMMGNVAIARGALEYGIGFASGYPGTPSSEIIEALSYASKKLGAPYVEWSVNEKVAFESAYGASLTGVPSLVSMKHVGLNVAADPLFSSAYTGVRASFVIVSADDPGMWSSQNEQDNRVYGLHAYIPVIEPAGVQEARIATIEAFRVSEKFSHPVMLRTTTRISHTRADILVGEINVERLKWNGEFVKEPSRYALVPGNARVLREELLKKWDSIEDYFNSISLNSTEGDRDSQFAIVGVGLGYRYAREAVVSRGIEDKVKLLKLSAVIPFPRRFILSNLDDVKRVLVVEEGDPIVENALKSILAEEKLYIDVLGKTNGYLKRSGELDLVGVEDAVLSLLSGQKPGSMGRTGNSRLRISIPPRPPVLCPGCPYRGVFFALRRAIRKLRVNPVYSGDIGCYSLGLNPPFRVQDLLIEMGGSIGVANGMAHVLEDQIVIAIIGDSTFFHSGVPGLINAVYNGAPFLLLILDNGTTAMTGHQPHPGTGITARGTRGKAVRIEDVVKAVGVDYVVVVNSFNVDEVEDGLVKALRYVGDRGKPAVVVARGSCILTAIPEARRRGVRYPVYEVVYDKCTACGVCYRAFNCPAITVRRDGKAEINPVLCTGCGVCAQICPFDAFKPVEKPSKEWINLLEGGVVGGE
ncbi:MAG: indolepyruvate ferredoxin oxidoreductase subunit alpha [Desulfurococcales archaeon]|nr:indolepyruvate ferredoxin oxidoreductase subunit alpha [Desulfurococcales archaeon]